MPWVVRCRGTNGSSILLYLVKYFKLINFTPEFGSLLEFLSILEKKPSTLSSECGLAPRPSEGPAQFLRPVLPQSRIIRN